MIFILPGRSVKIWEQRQIKKLQTEEIEKLYTANPALYYVNNLLLTDPQKLKLPKWHVTSDSSVEFSS